MSESSYDSTLDALKLTESEYELAVTEIVRQIQEGDTVDLTRAPRRDIRAEATSILDEHEYFAEFDGATFGGIVQWSSTDPAELTRWHIASDAKSALRRMAYEAMLQDILDQVRDIKYTTEGALREHDRARVEPLHAGLAVLFAGCIELLGVAILYAAGGF